MRKILLTALVLVLPASLARADCKEEILSMLDSLTKGGPYRTEAVITADQGRALVSSQVVPPDDVYSRQTMGDKSSEFLKIGERVWVKGADAWRELPAAPAARIAQSLADMKLRTPNLIANADCPGTRTVDGKDRIVYTYTLDVPGAASAGNTLYVDPVSRLPERMVVEQRGGAKRSVDMHYVFDASIKLQPPELAPAQPAPAAK